MDPGSALRLLPSGVGLIAPEKAVFEAMLEGWGIQQRSRGLKASTIKTRLGLVRRLAEHSGRLPWQWAPADGEAFISSLLGGPVPAALSTLRNYENQLRQFQNYLRDPVYEWGKACLDRFGEAPGVVFHEGNSIAHVADFEARPGRRAFTVDEAQALFDAADDLVRLAISRKRKGRLAAMRASALLKTTYAFGLRRHECVMLDLADFRRNPKLPDFGRFGALQVRWGKSSRGSAPKRRTVLLVPEMGWVTEVLGHWIDQARPVLLPNGGATPELWVTERGHRLSTSKADEMFRLVLGHAGLPPDGLDLHSLRHSYVTHLLEFGYPELFVQKQVGHVYAATTSLYSHVSDEFRNRLMTESLHRQMQGTVTGVPS